MTGFSKIQARVHSSRDSSSSQSVVLTPRNADLHAEGIEKWRVTYADGERELPFLYSYAVVEAVRKVLDGEDGKEMKFMSDSVTLSDLSARIFDRPMNIRQMKEEISPDLPFGVRLHYRTKVVEVAFQISLEVTNTEE